MWLGTAAAGASPAREPASGGAIAAMLPTQALIWDEPSVPGSTNCGWGQAQEVPGTATLDRGGSAAILSVSCASPGDCSAGGSYYASHHPQVFVVNETKGTWGQAEEVPGMAKLNVGGYALLDSVACASPGNCSAAGSYYDGLQHFQAFVVNEAKGTWGQAEEVPGTAKLNAGGNAGGGWVSCASPGNCSAGGFYTDASHHLQALVVNEANGTWGKAEDVPGTVKLNAGRWAQIDSVSCASAGYCSAAGFYRDASLAVQPFVVDETKGTWGKAVRFAGQLQRRRELLRRLAPPAGFRGERDEGHVRTGR